MFPPRGAASRGRSPYTDGLYPPPPATRYYEYNHQSLSPVNSFFVPGLQRLPTYEWKPTPSTSPVLPHRTPTMTNGRKRQIDEYSPHAVKRQRLDSSPDLLIAPSLIRGPPPRHPEVLAGSSRSGFDRRFASPHSRPRPQVPAVPESPNSLQTYAKDKLSDQMVELFEACQQQTSDLARKEMCRTRLQQDIQRVYEVARLYLTGSSMNGLGCRSSDADLCLVLKGNKRHDPIHVLSVLQRLFRSLSYVERIQLIRAKVPILRFREKGSDLEFDLNVNNTVGIRNTFLLRSYAYADLRIRPMILVVKKWARHNQINDASKGTLSSYTLVLMVLHYLQTLNEPVLPSLQRDYPECFNPLMDIDAVPDGPKHIPPYISRNQSSLGELLLGFLKYYATYFRWDEQVISVREARALPKQTCASLHGVETTLQNNTHSFVFKVRTMGSLSLAWVGDGSGVLLVLTTFQVPPFLMRFGQSNLYRSEDYGKTFKDVTHLINHTFIQTEFGIAISPDHSGKVMLTGDVSEVDGYRLFRSQDFGMTFVPTDLPFDPLIQMLYNPGDSNTLVTLSIKLDLWLSEDFGATWRKIHDSVCLVRWGPKNSIYFTTNYNGSCNDRGMLELRKTTDYGRSFQTIATRVYSFVLGGRFVFASIMTGTGTERMIHVSVDGGEVWNMAQLPTVNHEQFYSILTANQDMIFMHVDDPGDSGVGTIYVSDDRGAVFSKSLERHLYTTTGSDTDFTVISSLRGVYMTSVLTEDGAVETVITFDQGARWQTLRRPQNGHCDAETSTNRPNRCRLHIHAAYSTTMKMNVPMLPLSQSNAVGLILAHGSVGDAESALSPDVYVSDDGGYSWLFALKGPHHYAILDSGGLLVAMEHTHSTVNQIKFSTDEGQCWHTYNFTNDPLHFSGMDSEPGSRSMNISLWGYRNDFSKWVVITIDFRKLLTRDCTEGDYIQWLAHSADPTGSNDGCVLGYKETFLRLRKDTVCWNGRDYAVTKKLSPCPCTVDDYHCDFGYYRPENSSECVEQEEMKSRPLEFCLNGTTEQLQTSGYRKIPGDQCEGGFQPDRKETDLRRMCTSNALHPNSLTESSSPNTAVIVMVVIAILLISAVTGVWLVKKYVCGGRFLVHRYSVMREHVEANKIEGVDDVDTHYMETGKTQYNEDSDQDLLE